MGAALPMLVPVLGGAVPWEARRVAHTPDDLAVENPVYDKPVVGPVG